jgi:hypothetical protein
MLSLTIFPASTGSARPQPRQSPSQPDGTVAQDRHADQVDAAPREEQKG